MNAEKRLAHLLEAPEARDSALADLCRDLIADQQRLHHRLERISRISDRYQADLRATNAELIAANERLAAALREVRTLGGFIPICSCCKKVRDDAGYWDEVESYIARHSDAVLSRGRCPSCARTSDSGAPPPARSSDGEDAAERARLVAVEAEPAWTDHPLKNAYVRLSGDYQKLSRRLHKMSRISDGFQTQMKELNLTLARVSRTDPLTGLANRRALIERLERQAAEAGTGQGFSVAMIDLDNFKRINDSLGHAAGDAVLQTLSGLLAARVPAAALVGRWGGEEFLIVMDRGVGPALSPWCEALRTDIEGLIAEYNGRQLRVTASIGTAVHEPALTYEDTLRAADRALYAAKSCGRNRVVAFEEL